MQGSPKGLVTATAGGATAEAGATGSLERAVLAVVLAVLIGEMAYKTHQTWQMRGELERLCVAKASLVEEIWLLNHQLAVATNQVASLRENRGRVAQGNMEPLK